MRTPKKIREAIVKRVKSWRGSPTAKGAAMEEPRTSDMPKDVKDSLDVKEQTNADKATETDTELYEDINISRENLQPIFESSKEAQTTVEPTFVDRETNEKEPNPAEIELCFTIDEKDKPPTKTTQQRQAILAGVVGAVLLVVSVAFYALKIDATVALVMGIVGLACISFALYHALKPNTKFEKVESVNPTTTDLTFQL